jgi:hypothetical protein
VIYRNFTAEEVKGLRPDLVMRLDLARDLARVAFTLTDTTRTPEDAKALGLEDSAHTTGWAVDIRVSSSHQCFRILLGLFLAGFTRIGVYDHHLHVDADPTKPPEVVWKGKSKSLK